MGLEFWRRVMGTNRDVGAEASSCRDVVDLDRAEAAWNASTLIVGEFRPLSPNALTLRGGRRGDVSGDVEERGREGEDAA